MNRIWFWLFGRGIVHEPDDLRSTNPPENPELLKYLEQELASHNYELKHVYRLILNSRTYQLSSKSNRWNAGDVAHFSHYPVKRLGAETLLDAIGQVTERWDTYRSTIPEPFVVMPSGFRATHLADGSIDLPFLQLFGRPPRDTAYESDRDLELSMRQTLHLLNSSDVQNKINASPRLRQLISEVKEDPKVVEELYLSTLSRFPTDEERTRILAYMSGEGKTIPEDVKAAKEAEAAAAQAKAALSKATAAQANAEKTAAAKHQQANQAKKKLDDLVQNQQTPAEAKLAADAKALTAAAARAAADQPLAEAKAAAAQAQQAYEAAENAAQQAEAEAKKIAEDQSKSEEEKKQAAAEAAAKRKAADEAKTALTQARQKQQQAQSQSDAAAQKLAQAETQKKSAEQALANVKNQVAAATQANQAAQNAAKEALAAAATAKAEADRARAAQTASEKAAAEKRKPANEAKAGRDKLAGDEKAANNKLAEAARKVSAAQAALKPRRDQAIQDLLWALLNTKEFVFNH